MPVDEEWNNCRSLSLDFRPVYMEEFVEFSNNNIVGILNNIGYGLDLLLLSSILINNQKELLLHRELLLLRSG